MKVFPEPLSDEDYVERIRRSLKRSRVASVMRFVFAIGIALGVTMVVRMLILVAQMGAPSGTTQGMVYLTFVVAVIFGLFTSNLLIHLIAHRTVETTFRRTHELLIENWDTRRELEQSLKELETALSSANQMPTEVPEN